MIEIVLLLFVFRLRLGTCLLLQLQLLNEGVLSLLQSQEVDVVGAAQGCIWLPPLLLTLPEKKVTKVEGRMQGAGEGAQQLILLVEWPPWLLICTGVSWMYLSLFLKGEEVCADGLACDSG